MENPIKISYNDLSDPKVDEVLKRQSDEIAFRTGAGVAGDSKRKVKFIYKSWFNLMIAGVVGAFIAWAMIEPYFDDNDVSVGISFLLLMSVGGLIGLFVGATEGILSRNVNRAIKGGAIGLGIGFAGGAVSTFIANIIMAVIVLIGSGIVGKEGLEDGYISFGELMLFVIARTLAWTVAGMTVGLGPGIALKSKKLAFNGFLGGMIGGAIGGLLFDPINYLISGGTLAYGAEASRAIGFCVIGAFAGFMIGLVDMLSKDAWFLMTSGSLKGKQFIIYKDPTIIGSSPQSEIYLFKETSVDPKHATIHTMRDGYEIEDMNTNSGTLLNGKRIKRQRLFNNDIIQIGETTLIYSEKEKNKK